MEQWDLGLPGVGPHLGVPEEDPHYAERLEYHTADDKNPGCDNTTKFFTIF